MGSRATAHPFRRWTRHIALDAFSLLTEYARLMPRHGHPLRSPRKLASLIVSLFLTAVLNLLGCSAHRPVPIDGNYRVVERVIDGDTLALKNGERVRLIGVDTPETKHPSKPVEHFGKEAAAFTRRMVEGKRVRLE